MWGLWAASVGLMVMVVVVCSSISMADVPHDRLERDLLQLLQEAGWQEQLKQTCQERLRERDPARRVKSFAELLQAVEGDAAGSVPDAVRARMVQSVLGVLRNMVE